MQTLTEKAHRSLKCPVCGSEKSKGAIVCWGKCWSDPQTGLKYSGLNDDKWLQVNAQKL